MMLMSVISKTNNTNKKKNRNSKLADKSNLMKANRRFSSLTINHQELEEEKAEKDPKKKLMMRRSLMLKQMSSYSLFLLLLIGLILSFKVSASSSSNFQTDIELLDGSSNYPPLQAFDASSYKSVYDAIRNHPELREFNALCDSEEVKEIVSVTKTPLTVFAPIDKSLSDLLSKSKSRSINLVELTKHHLAPILVTPDEHTKFPLQFSSYPRLSPLYLNQVQVATVRASAGSQQQVLYVNNARILASYLIPIDDTGDSFQALHIIDQPLDYAYRRSQMTMRGQQRAHKQVVAQRRSSLSLDDLASGNGDFPFQPVVEFYENFADLLAQSIQADLYKTRVFRGSQQTLERISLERKQLNIERLIQAARAQLPEFRSQLYQVNETSSYNTYFLPVQGDELLTLLGQSSLNPQELASSLRALIIPNQVLFTRTMQLGRAHSSSAARVSLSLAKSQPADSASSPAARFLTTPLLVQAECKNHSPADHEIDCREGVTSAEILVANIPLSHGVLHLIRKPLLLTSSSSSNLLEYLNDNDAQLSSQLSAFGSRTKQPAAHELQQPVTVNRFRELLARERQLLALMTNSQKMNMTILAPSDEAFASLRFDLRALVHGDESLIPRDWDPSYRADLLQRLVKRHIIPHEAITSEQILEHQRQPLSLANENGKLLTFSQDHQTAAGSTIKQLQVYCDSEKARFLHRDLSASNGVLHIIERVLGEQQETVYTLLKSIMLRLSNQNNNEINSEEQQLAQIISNNLRDQSSQQQQSVGSSSENSLLSSGSGNQSEELALISKSIGQYLNELNTGSRRQVAQALASSVNISYQLARLVSQAEGSDDWNEKLGEPDSLFTYFVPSDLAWLRLQQAQPELYKPLTHFLELQQQQQQEPLGQTLTSDGSNSISSIVPKSPRSSKSSHRLRQILERHLVVNRKIAKKDLSQLDSLETLGATLRLVEANDQKQQLSANSLDGSNLSNSAYAALHTGGGGNPTQLVAGNHIASHQQALNQQMRLKTLRLGEFSSANIVQANEASNGFVYIIDNVLILPDDSDHIVQTSSLPADSSTMSSLLGAHNSAILDFFQWGWSHFTTTPSNMSAQPVLILIGSLTVAITLLLLMAFILVMRRRCQNKLNRHQQLESGLTSGSSANSGSTSTTKSL